MTCTQAPCTHPREAIAVDSTGHEIFGPCHQCLLEWRQKHYARITPPVTPDPPQEDVQELAEGEIRF